VGKSWSISVCAFALASRRGVGSVAQIHFPRDGVARATGRHFPRGEKSELKP